MASILENISPTFWVSAGIAGALAFAADRRPAYRTPLLASAGVVLALGLLSNRSSSPDGSGQTVSRPTTTPGSTTTAPTTTTTAPPTTTTTTTTPAPPPPSTPATTTPATGPNPIGCTPISGSLPESVVIRARALLKLSPTSPDVRYRPTLDTVATMRRLADQLGYCGSALGPQPVRDELVKSLTFKALEFEAALRPASTRKPRPTLASTLGFANG